jgi:hypothetical protein
MRRLRLHQVLGIFSLLVSTGLAQAAAAVAPAGPDQIVNCEDRLRLDRRDDPQNAIRNFRQCSTSQSVSLRIENVTFWYITSPSSAKDFKFDTAWKNNLAILTGQFVGFKPEQAIEILDDAIVRGLRRGKREDLIARWLASHNSGVLAPAQAAGAQKAAAAAETPAAVAETPVKPEPDKTSRNVGRRSNLQHHTTRRISQVHQSQRRYAHRHRYGDVDPTSSTRLDWPQVENTYEQAAAPGRFYTESYQPPALVGVPAPQVSAPYAPVAQQPVFLQPDALRPPPFPPAAQQQPQYPSIPQQVEKNIRTITGLIEENIYTVQRTLFGPPRP